MKAPPRIKGRELERYYTREQLEKRGPGLVSARCDWWLIRFRAGWRPSRHVRSLGYYGKAEHFGVYIAEWLYILSPALAELEKTDRAEGRAQPVRAKRLLCEPLNPPRERRAAAGL